MQKNTIVEKKCRVCKRILPISKFRRFENRSGTFGYRNSCRKCERAQERERYQQQKAQLIIDNYEKNDTFRFRDFYKKVKGG